MERFVKDDVVIIPFPFSDLSASKRRPAFVLANLKEDDIILCQITSQNNKDHFAVPLTKRNFTAGTLPVNSYIRPTRIFTADKHIIIRKAGKTHNLLHNRVVRNLLKVIE